MTETGWGARIDSGLLTLALRAASPSKSPADDFTNLTVLITITIANFKAHKRLKNWRAPGFTINN